MRTLLLSAAALAALCTPSQAQLQLPKKSPKASTTQTLAATEITIDYHRPAVRGRTIWGDLVPYDKTWRAGANNATTVSFGGDVEVAGQHVPKGRYALFVVPKKAAWTVILNSVDNQWGSRNHDPKQDVARFDVEPTKVANQEYLLYSIEPIALGQAQIQLSWEKLRIAIPVEVDVQALMQQRIAEAIAAAGPDDWQIYYRCAKYHLDNKLDLLQALEWSNKSVEIKQSSWNLDQLAQLLHATGDTAEAIPPLQRALELARADKSVPADYIARVEQTLKEWQASL
jgi:hypothetical protein